MKMSGTCVHQMNSANSNCVVITAIYKKTLKRKIYMKNIRILLIGAISVLLMGCASRNSNQAEKEAVTQVDTGFVMATAGVYDSVDTAVVIRRNAEEQTITFRNAELGKNYTLNYDSSTYVKDKYETAISMEQVMPGDIVEVTFYKERKRLNSLMISPTAWTYSGVEKFEVGRNNQSFTIVNEEYKLDSNVTILSEGEEIEFMDLNAVDTLTVRGIDHTILSIMVEEGHGYLRLSNDEYLVGGWIEVGQKLIQPITEGMLLVVPEGSYQVQLSNKGVSATKEITIERNKEVELDVGDVKAAEPQMGKIIFSTTPTTAKIYIDGNLIDTSEVVSLEYGIHQMIVKAGGYQTITQYLKVGQGMASVDVTMEKNDEEEETKSVSENSVSEDDSDEYDEIMDSIHDWVGDKDAVNDKNNGNNSNKDDGSKDNNTVSGNNTISGGSNSYKVKVEAPTGAEVYLDGNYVGIAPVEFKKKAGSHTISLRKSGYQTRSYTIEIDSEKKDITYSFSELVKE